MKSAQPPILRCLPEHHTLDQRRQECRNVQSMKPAEELKGRLKVKVQGKNTLEKDANGKGRRKEGLFLNPCFEEFRDIMCRIHMCEATHIWPQKMVRLAR